MTPAARNRAPFELLRFTAAPVSGALVVLELEGRFPRPAGRFGRPPVLVVEPGEDRPRLELPPVRTAIDDGRWRGAYAVPAETMIGTPRLALGLRGTLLELPAPDEPDDGRRFTVLAREANGLRRALELAEADAARARAEAAVAISALEAAVEAAREEAGVAAAERIAALEHELDEAQRRAAEDVEGARTTAGAEHEQVVADMAARHEQALAEAGARAADAERQAEEAEARALAAEAGTDVLRAELAEERERAHAAIAQLQQEIDEAGDDADPDETVPFTVAEQRDADEDATAPLQPTAVHRLHPPGEDGDVLDPVEPVTPEGRSPSYRGHGPNLSRWLAVAALLLFAFVLLGLLFGFVG